MPIYRTVHRLESRSKGVKQIVPAGREIALDAAEAAALGDAVELVSSVSEAPEITEQPEETDSGKASGPSKSAK